MVGVMELKAAMWRRFMMVARINGITVCAMSGRPTLVFGVSFVVGPIRHCPSDVNGIPPAFVSPCSDSAIDIPST